MMKQKVQEIDLHTFSYRWHHSSNIFEMYEEMYNETFIIKNLNKIEVI